MILLHMASSGVIVDVRDGDFIVEDIVGSCVGLGFDAKEGNEGLKQSMKYFRLLYAVAFQ